MGKMTDEQLAEQKKFVEEAFAFINVPCGNVTVVEANHVTAQGNPIVAWDMDGVAGSYELGNTTQARVSVVMSWGMVHHRYGDEIYETILACDRYQHPHPGRNNLLEIFYRKMLVIAFSKFPYSQAQREIEKAFHFDANFEEMKAAVVAARALDKAKRELNGD